MWRLVLSQDNKGTSPSMPPAKIEPGEEERSVEQQGDAPVKTEDAAMLGHSDGARIVDTCIANIEAQLPVLRIGWELVLVIGEQLGRYCRDEAHASCLACTLDGEIIFHRDEFERCKSMRAP